RKKKRAWSTPNLRVERNLPVSVGRPNGDFHEISVLSRVVEVGEDSRQALAEHLAPAPPEQLGHEEAANAGEPGVLVGKAGAAANRFKAVGDLGGIAAAVVGPGVAEQDRFARLKDLAVHDAVPARLGLGHEAELGARDRGEALRASACARRGPPRDQVRVGQGPPDPGYRVRVVADDSDLAHEELLAQIRLLSLKKYSNRKFLATVKVTLDWGHEHRGAGLDGRTARAW